MRLRRSLSAFFAISLGAQCSNPNRITVSSTPVTITLPDGVDVDRIPMDVSAKGARISVSINGHPPRSLHFDTGSTRNVLTMSAAEKLGLRRLEADDPTMIGRLKVTGMVYYAEHMQIGRTRFEHVLFTVHEPSELTDKNAKELLGFMNFGKNVFALDLARNELVIYRNPPTEIRSWSEMDLSHLEIPFIQVTLRHPKTGDPLFEFPAAIDSGAKSQGHPMLMMPRSIRPSDPRIAPFLKGEGETITMSTLYTDSQFTYFQTELPIEFGPVETEGTYLLFFENEGEGSFVFEDRGILGLSMFKGAVLTFDIPKSRWSIDYPVVGEAGKG